MRTILTELAAQLADATLGAEVDETTFADAVDDFLANVLDMAYAEAAAMLGADADEGPLGLITGTITEIRLRAALVDAASVPAA